jgi:hypothetical protein
MIQCHVDDSNRLDTSTDYSTELSDAFFNGLITVVSIKASQPNNDSASVYYE